MALTYEAQDDDSLLLIAHRHGFARWETIWEHAENGALRELRGAPERLVKGDKVVIPDKAERWMRVSTDKKHTFELSRPDARLRVVLTDRFGEPLVRKPCKVTMGRTTMDGHTSGGDEPDGVPGLIDCPLPLDTRAVHIAVDVGGRTLEWDVEVGFIPPTDLTVGLQVALQNLGYLGQGGVTGTLDEPTKKALRLFQRHAALPETGATDDETLQALEAQLFLELPSSPAAKR